MGDEAVFPLLVRCRPEVVIALGDVWWLPYLNAPHTRRQMELTDAPWLLYFPIDGDMEGERLPESWTSLLREVDVPIAMSRYGQRIVEQSGIACRYIPHGVDLNIFCPPESRAAAKARIYTTDGTQSGDFLILSDSRNQPRKMLPRLLDVFAKFAAVRPGARLHLHTDPDDEFTRSGVYSYDLRADLRHHGVESRVTFTPGMSMKHRGGVPLAALAAYYQAADVHLLASSGEGFGLPTLQAAAAGAVPIAGAYSASRELCEGHGVPVRIAEWSENEFGIRRGMIDIDDAVRHLTALYDDRALLASASARSRGFAMAYGWEEIVGQWDALLNSIGSRRRRIEKKSTGKQVSIERLATFAPRVSDGSVKVTVVERQFGRLESGIIQDSRKHLSDVRVPGLQKSCEVAGLRVVRSPAYVAVTTADREVFSRLKRIFPILGGWMPGFGGVFDTLDPSIRAVPIEDWRQVRYELVQSVLMINLSGDFPQSVLMDAALYGVPCIGAGSLPAQCEFWPELEAETTEEAVALARGLLTNPASLRKASARGRELCVIRYAPDQHDAAAWLRRAHASARRIAARPVGAS